MKGGTTGSCGASYLQSLADAARQRQVPYTSVVAPALRVPRSQPCERLPSGGGNPPGTIKTKAVGASSPALSFAGIAEEILELKRTRRAIILAHHYQDNEIQDLADAVGDSLELARTAQKFDGDVIAFCGVWFIAAHGT